jgi:hypothetical protein
MQTGLFHTSTSAPATAQSGSAESTLSPRNQFADTPKSVACEKFCEGTTHTHRHPGMHNTVPHVVVYADDGSGRLQASWCQDGPAATKQEAIYPVNTQSMGIWWSWGNITSPGYTSPSYMGTLTSSQEGLNCRTCNSAPHPCQQIAAATCGKQSERATMKTLAGTGRPADRLNSREVMYMLGGTSPGARGHVGSEGGDKVDKIPGIFLNPPCQALWVRSAGALAGLD